MVLQSQKLLEFLYRAPIALVTAYVDGSIQAITPVACQWLMPLSKDGNLDNIFVLLEDKIPTLRSQVANITSDVICEDFVFSVDQPNSFERHLSISVSLFIDGHIAMVFSDVSHERQSRLIAEAATQFKTNFLANMSHEIRTPLNAIMNMGYLIRKDGVTPSQAEKIEKLEYASRHLLSIISDILDLSKVDAGKLELELVPLRPDQLVAEVITMFSERAQIKGNELLAEDFSLPVNLLGDPTRLKQILINFVSNAIKFTTAGRIVIRAKVLDETDLNVMLYFEVSDTGIGIESAAMKKLFASFEQAESSTTRKYGGSGLGLAISKQLIQLLDGEVGVRSEVGIGSTFWFTARLSKLQQLENLVPTPIESIEILIDRLRSQCSGFRVLLVEDESINSEIIGVFLEDIGFVVDLAEDGQEALELANTTSYHLICMDTHMPRMNGLDASRAIKKMALHVDTPIIAITASPFSDERDRCREAGMNWFLPKPMLPETLYAMILDVIQRK